MSVRHECKLQGPSHEQWNPLYCGAKLNDGTYCVRYRVKRVDGTHAPKCPTHLKEAISREVSAVRSRERDSYLLREEVSAKFRVLRDNPNLLDLQDELAIFKAYLDAGLQRWQDSNEKLEFEEISWVFDKIEQLSILIERIIRIRNETALTIAEIHYLQVQIAKILKKYIPEEKLRPALEELFKITSSERQTDLTYRDRIEEGIIVKGESRLGPDFAYVGDFLDAQRD